MPCTPARSRNFTWRASASRSRPSESVKGVCIIGKMPSSFFLPSAPKLFKPENASPNEPAAAAFRNPRLVTAFGTVIVSFPPGLFPHVSANQSFVQVDAEAGFLRGIVIPVLEPRHHSRHDFVGIFENPEAFRNATVWSRQYQV